MLAPDGKKSKLTMTDLQNVINQLPEPSDLERKRREDMKAAMKEYEKKNKKKEIAARDSANGIHIEGKTGRQRMPMMQKMKYNL